LKHAEDDRDLRLKRKLKKRDRNRGRQIFCLTEVRTKKEEKKKTRKVLKERRGVQFIKENGRRQDIGSYNSRTGKGKNRKISHTSWSKSNRKART